MGHKDSAFFTPAILYYPLLHAWKCLLIEVEKYSCCWKKVWNKHKTPSCGWLMQSQLSGGRLGFRLSALFLSFVPFHLRLIDNLMLQGHALKFLFICSVSLCDKPLRHKFKNQSVFFLSHSKCHTCSSMCWSFCFFPVMFLALWDNLRINWQIGWLGL